MKKLLNTYRYSIVLLIIIAFAFGVGCMVGSLIHKASEPIYVEYLSEAEDSSVEPVNFKVETSTEDRTSLGEFMLTGYCICSDCCGGYSDGYTATMTIATPGRTIAVDPEVIPYGSIVEINGEEYVAEDCGTAIKGNHIDMLCASHELAQSFGVQYAEVYVVNQ